MTYFIFQTILARVSECYRYFACFGEKPTDKGEPRIWGLIWAFSKVIPLYNIQISSIFRAWLVKRLLNLGLFRLIPPRNGALTKLGNFQIINIETARKLPQIANRGQKIEICELNKKGVKINE